MRLITIVSISFLSILMYSCTKCGDYNEIENENIIVFGSYFGECLGDECVNVYKYYQGDIYEDTSDVYPHGGGDFALIDQSILNVIGSELDSLSNLASTTSSQTIGCPDCRDQGGIFVIYDIGDAVSLIDIDPSTQISDDKLLAIRNLTIEILEKLKE